MRTITKFAGLVALLALAAAPAGAAVPPIDTAASPHAACKDLSKKHTKGEKGTPFSRCVVEGAKLLREQRAQSQG
jgi:Spy/CpxP family protein refolding chaperone